MPVRIDAVITDPPYGIKAGQGNTLLAGAYLAFDDSEEYVKSICVLIVVAAMDRAKCLAMTPGIRCMFAYPQPAEIGCFFNPAGAGLGRWGFTCMHPILYYGADPHNRTKPNSLCSHAITKENGHPCPKPREYMDWLVDRASLPGWTVLDPFMGSGTTGVACVKLRRKFISIELSKEYCKIAVDRIKREIILYGDMRHLKVGAPAIRRFTADD